MTTWSVVKSDSGEKRRRRLIPRIALLACLALVVVSLGIALSPGTPTEPAEPPFSEQARSAALAETMRLRTAGQGLGRSTSGDAAPALALTVSLLTDQARALLLPGQVEPDAAPAVGPAPPSAGPSSAATAASAPATLPASATALAAALADSAGQRLADAAVADGGIARLLASVGTAQLLQASSLAAAAGAPAPAVPDPAVPRLSGTCPGAAAAPSASPADAPAAPAAPAASAASAASAGAEANAATLPATLPGALAAAVRTELETVYGYQVALTRLDGAAAARAAEQLAAHEALAAGAEALSRVQCAPVPQREAGYTMKPGFLAAPAAGLGGLEASALPVYGDLVALSEGQTRQWAIAGLVGAARRSAVWGAETGALPGLAADPAGFPELPVPSP